jgi:type IV pilus assembly protein PilX
MNMTHAFTQHTHQHTDRRQRGAVLVVSLIMLLILTIIGVTGMRTTVLEEKMAGNMRDQNLAFQAAEAALRDGEDIIQSLVAISSFDGTSGRLNASDSDPDFFAPSTWSSTSSIAYSGTLSDVATQPRFILKYIGQIESNTGSLNVGSYGKRSTNTVANFRVTARGTGRSDNSQVTLQGYYGKVL